MWVTGSPSTRRPPPNFHWNFNVNGAGGLEVLAKLCDQPAWIGYMLEDVRQNNSIVLPVYSGYVIGDFGNTGKLHVRVIGQVALESAFQKCLQEFPVAPTIIQNAFTTHMCRKGLEYSLGSKMIEAQ